MNKNIIYCATEEEFLLNKYYINETDEHGMNALFHSDLVKSKWLIKHGIDMYHVDHEDNNVMMNISSGDLDKAQYLLDIGYELSFFFENPEKLSREKMRSQPVRNLILQNIINAEKHKISQSIELDEIKPVLFLKKRL